MQTGRSRVFNALFNRYVGAVFLFLLALWVASTQEFGYWLKPAANAFFFGFREMRGFVQYLFGRAFLVQVAIFWLWFLLYLVLISIIIGNAVRRIASINW